MTTPIRFAPWCSTALPNGALALCLALCVLASGLTASAQSTHIITFDAPGADTTGDNNGTYPSSINIGGRSRVLPRHEQYVPRVRALSQR